MRRPAVLLMAVAVTLGAASTASAATFNVTTTADGTAGCTIGVCTLRAAIAAAFFNGTATPDTITVPAGAYTLTAAAGGQLDVQTS